MSTNGVIARIGKHEGEFSGAYHHWDSNPTSLGAYLWTLLDGHFKNDLSKMLQVLIDQHSSWSTIVGKDFKLKPGFTNPVQRPEGMSLDDFFNLPLQRRPQCHCHGQRHEVNEPFTEKDLEASTLEWVYAFDEPERKLCVRDVRNHEDVAVIDLTGEEPNWTAVECGENFEWCSHMAWYHKLAPQMCNLSTQTWLERQPLEFHDVVAVIIGGKRFKTTGCGGDSDYPRRTAATFGSHYETATCERRLRQRRKNFPSGFWIETVVAGNGKRHELPVAKIVDGKQVPAPGVTWVFPPTQNHPQGSEVSA